MIHKVLLTTLKRRKRRLISTFIDQLLEGTKITKDNLTQQWKKDHQWNDDNNLTRGLDLLLTAFTNSPSNLSIKIASGGSLSAFTHGWAESSPAKSKKVNQ